MSTLKKLITQVSLLASAIFCSQVAIACPEVFDTSGLIKFNTSNDIDAETIYFCKQNGFTINQLSVSFEPNTLIAGGNQAIVMGNTVQHSPIQSSVNLIGTGPQSLDLKSLGLVTNFPKSGGQYNIQSIFNFYSRVPNIITNRCNANINNVNQYEMIKAYLRTNASTIFKAKNLSTNAIKSAKSLSNGNDIAVIEGAEIGLKNSTIKADITFYHANPNTNGQYFTGGNKRFCWVGISSRINLKDDAKNINDAGTYSVDIGVYKP